MSTFTHELTRELDRIRMEFANRDMNHMEFRVEVTGPVHGDLKIEFVIDGNYECRSVRGNSVDAVLEEFFRRNTWQKRHDFLALPFATQTAFANMDDK